MSEGWRGRGRRPKGDVPGGLRDQQLGTGGAEGPACGPREALGGWTVLGAKG